MTAEGSAPLTPALFKGQLHPNGQDASISFFQMRALRLREVKYSFKDTQLGLWQVHLTWKLCSLLPVPPEIETVRMFQDQWL